MDGSEEKRRESLARVVEALRSVSAEALEFKSDCKYVILCRQADTSEAMARFMSRSFQELGIHVAIMIVKDPDNAIRVLELQ